MMKYLFVLLFFISFSCIAQRQSKDTKRYFEVAYIGIDSTGNFVNGIHFFSTFNNGFPTIEQTKALVIETYHLSFTPFNNKLSIWITEFKNRSEWMKWNRGEELK